ncbi:putative BOI-related E3 ubiquitin-protein ligase 3 [Senna tora]|uniref:Putative BOI-related E3 ubiquitin-protein ligase 3 n=1 Tax=Senna tora TaxID=362788 RepID=A0A834SWB7_9FABA|nr:putative BOI-related E3 ubiquitin-protein ligase 3 [Senna tora]
MAIQAHLYSNNLGFPLDLMIENGHGHGNAGFAQSCFNSPQKQQRNQNNMLVDNTNLLFSSSPSSNSMPISQALALQFEKQSQDIDRYIKLQNEKLRMMLEEQRKQQVVALVKRVESETIFLMRQKEEEIAQARKKKVELEEFVRRLEQENEAWKKVAQEKEAMVLSLHNTLEQMKERGAYNNNNKNGVVVVTDDAGSCCNEEEREVRNCGGEEERKKMGCKRCFTSISSSANLRSLADYILTWLLSQSTSCRNLLDPNSTFFSGATSPPLLLSASTYSKGLYGDTGKKREVSEKEKIARNGYREIPKHGKEERNRGLAT